jgi:hypothetical protein
MRRCTSADTPTSPGEQLIFGSYIPDTYLYQYGSPPQFIPAHWSTTADCILTQESQYTTNGVANYLGVQLLSTYTSEITLTQSASITSLDVRSGKIKQNDTVSLANNAGAGTITVMQGLNWIGGTINSNTVAGNLDLYYGANGTIHPDGGTVNLGSTLTLLGGAIPQIGSTLTVESGTVKVNRGDGFVVNMLCLLLVQPKAESDTTAVDPKVTLDGGPAPPVNGILTVKPGGKLLVKAKDRPANNVQPATFVVKGNNSKVNNFGETEVRDRSFIQVSNSGAAGYEQDQPNADKPLRTILEAGCGITCTVSSVIVIRKGTLELAERRGTNGVPEDEQPKIVITGTANADWVLRIQQGATLKRADAAPKAQLILDIQGGRSSRSPLTARSNCTR